MIAPGRRATYPTPQKHSLESDRLSLSELLPEQAIDDACSDEQTEDDEIPYQTGAAIDH
jgi:hypothetical protein